MSITFSLLKNKLYLIDKWMSKGSGTLLVLLLVTSTLMVNFESTMFYGIGLLLIICLWVVFIKAKILGGELKFDKSYYTLPVIGETIVVQKDFKYDLNKVSNQKNYIHSKNFISIYKGLNFHIVDIKELDDNWVIKLRLDKYDEIIEVFWLDVKDYFMTITDIREEKLKKILK